MEEWNVFRGISQSTTFSGTLPGLGLRLMELLLLLRVTTGRELVPVSVDGAGGGCDCRCACVFVGVDNPSWVEEGELESYGGDAGREGMVSRCERRASPSTANDGRAPRGRFFLNLAPVVPLSVLPLPFPSQLPTVMPFSATTLRGLSTLTDAIIFRFSDKSVSVFYFAFVLEFLRGTSGSSMRHLVRDV